MLRFGFNGAVWSFRAAVYPFTYPNKIIVGGGFG